MSKKKVFIINYGSGNLYSVCKALHLLDYKPVLVSNPELLKKADKIIIPGVGSFEQGINNLKKNYLDLAIIDYVNKGKDLLGICLGMQLLMKFSSEFGNNKGLSLVNGSVKKIKSNKKSLIPHIGWNNVNIGQNKLKLLNGVSKKNFFYFVHSYHVHVEEKIDFNAKTKFGANSFSSIIKKNNIFGLQFHPEKSRKIGLKMIKNFLDL